MTVSFNCLMQDMNDNVLNSEDRDIVMSKVHSDLEKSNLDMSMTVDKKVNFFPFIIYLETYSYVKSSQLKWY